MSAAHFLQKFKNLTARISLTFHQWLYAGLASAHGAMAAVLATVGDTPMAVLTALAACLYFGLCVHPPRH